MQHRCLSALALALCGSLTSAQAAPPAPALSLGLDTALTTSPQGPTVSTLGGAVSIAGAYRFAGGLGVSLVGGFTAVSLEIEGQSTRRGTYPGNLLLGASFDCSPLELLDTGVSFQLGAPLALYPGGIDDNRLAELAYTMAASAEGFRAPFLWQTNVVPFVLGARASFRALDWLTLTGHLSPAYLLSVNQRPSRLAVASGLDASVTLEPLMAHAGLWYFASTLPLENRQLDQLAARLGAGTSWQGQRLMLDLSIGLDAPYGAFESAPHPWWGLGVAADVHFGSVR